MTRETNTAGESHGAAQKSSSPLTNPKVRIALFIAAILLVAGLGAWFIRHQTWGKYQQATDNAYVAADTVVVAPKIAGYVDRVLVRENQWVRSGEPLVQLDVRDYRAQAAQFQAQIAAALANADTIRAQQREQDAAIRQATAQVAATEAQARLAADQVSRYRPLAATGAEPREKLDQLEAQSRQAQAQLDAAKAVLTAARRRLSTLGEQVEQANSQASAARAQLESAELDVSSTRLRASVAGRVGDLTVRAGQFVQPGQRLMSLVPSDQVYVTANYKETQVGLIRPGQPVRLEIDALPGVELVGRVESIAPGTGAEFSILPPQNATGNFTKIVQRVPVRISIQAATEIRRLLVPGMSVVATIDTRGAKGELDRLRAEAR